MSNNPATPQGQNIGAPEAPDDFGADIAAIFQQRETRSFDPNATRADLGADAGDPPGGPVAAMGNQRDADLVPPGGWPGGETVDVSQSAPEPSTSTTPDEDTAPASSGVVGDDAAQLPPPAGEPQSAPADDGQPEATPGVAEGEGLPAPDPSATPAPTAPGYTYTFKNADGTDGTVNFTSDQVEQALSLRAWAEQLPEHTRIAMAQIEEGQAVALPRAEFDRYQAWLNQQQRADRDRDLDQYDEDAQREIQRLRDENAKLTGQPAPQQPAQPSIDPNVDANLTATAQAFDNAVRDYQTRNSLTQQELDSLLDSVVQANIIGGIQQSHTQFNPVTGAVTRHADPNVVMSKALDAALTWNPEIHNAVAQRRAATTTPSPAPQPDPVTQKKANAASLASAPSAAVPPTPRTAPLTGQAAVDAMAAELMTVMQRA